MNNNNGSIGLSEKFLKNHEKSSIAYRSLLQSFGADDTTEPDYPKHFGGAFINDEGKLVICVLGDVENAENDFFKRTNDSDTIINPCDYSFNDLTGIMDRLNLFKKEHPESKTATNIKAFALKIAKNRIVVELEEHTQQRIDELYKEVPLSSFSCVEFIQSSGEFIDLIDVGPGAMLSVSQGNLSAGYRAKHNGNEGIVTAAHGTGIDTVVKFNGIDFAKMIVRQENGAVDAVFCNIDNPKAYVPSNWFGAGNITLEDKIINPIKGSVVGLASASSLSPPYGKIDEVNFSLTTSSGVNFTNLTSVKPTTQAPIPGDSGGCVFCDYIGTGLNEICGVLKGKFIDDSLWFYSKASEINKTLNLTMFV